MSSKKEPSKPPASFAGGVGAGTPGAAPIPFRRPPKGPRPSVVKSKGDVTVSGLQIKEWQKTPMTLLLDYCTHNKRPKPRYDQLESRGGGVRYRVVLQDPKRPGSDKDLIFLAADGSGRFDDDLDAKHTIALLALHSLEGTRPYEQKLPEPYRSLWLTLSGTPPTASAPAAGAGDAKAKGKAGAPAGAGATPSSGGGGGGASAAGGGAPRAQTAGGASAAPAIVAVPAAPSATAPLAATAAPAATAAGSATGAARTTAVPPPAAAVPTAGRVAVTAPAAGSSAASTFTSVPTVASAAPVRPPTAAAAAAPAGAAAATLSRATPPAPTPPAPAAPSSAPTTRRALGAVPMGARLAASSGSAADQKKRNNERDSRRRERENKRAAGLAAAALRNADTLVSMSGANRDYVEGVLRELGLLGSAPGSGSLTSSGGGDDSALDHAIDGLSAAADASVRDLAALQSAAVSDDDREALLLELCNLGFPEEAAEDAIGAAIRSLSATHASAATSALAAAATGRSGKSGRAGSAGGGPTAPLGISPDEISAAALDWLCLNLPEADIPQRFTPKGRGELKLLNAGVLGSMGADGGSKPGSSGGGGGAGGGRGGGAGDCTPSSSAAAAAAAAAAVGPPAARPPASIFPTAPGGTTGRPPVASADLQPLQPALASAWGLSGGDAATALAATGALLSRSEGPLSTSGSTLQKGGRSDGDAVAASAGALAVAHALITRQLQAAVGVGRSLGGNSGPSPPQLAGGASQASPALASGSPDPLSGASGELEALLGIYGADLHVVEARLSGPCAAVLLGPAACTAWAAAMRPHSSGGGGVLPPAPGSPSAGAPGTGELGSWEDEADAAAAAAAAAVAAGPMPHLPEASATAAAAVADGLVSLRTVRVACGELRIPTSGSGGKARATVPVRATLCMAYAVPISAVFSACPAPPDIRSTAGTNATEAQVAAAADAAPDLDRLLLAASCAPDGPTASLFLPYPCAPPLVHVELNGAVLGGTEIHGAAPGDPQLPSAPDPQLTAASLFLNAALLVEVERLRGEQEAGGTSGSPLAYELISWVQNEGAAAAAGVPSPFLSQRASAAAAGGKGAATVAKSAGSSPSPFRAAAEGGDPATGQAGGRAGSGPRGPTPHPEGASVLARGPPRIPGHLEAAMCGEDSSLSSRAGAVASAGSSTGRGRLPIAGYRAAIVDLIGANQVVLLSGETGCGKTTQVPQFLLDDAISRGCGGHARIIVTQPRRIAAIGVATRVAAERGEPLGVRGGAVGYQIRGEKRSHPGTELLFTTTGVLLRRLVNGGLGHVTHIIVDEVHERGVDTDFLLAVLRRVLPHRRDVRVVLMSATMDAVAFAQYFGAGAPGSGSSNPSRLSNGGGWPSPAGCTVLSGAAAGHAAIVASPGCCPVISVPGFVHPVAEAYLDAILQITGYRPRITGAKGQAGQRPPPANGTGAQAAAAADDPVPGDDGEEEEEEGGAAEGGAPSPAASPTAAVVVDIALDPHAWRRHGLDYGLVASLIHAVCAGRGVQPPSPSASSAPQRHNAVGSTSGAILVFLPGVGEIRRLHRELERTGSVGHMAVLHLHGSLTSAEQGLVFRPPPHGKRKVVLATNVAETSITIDDVTVVIDTLRVKEASYDPLNKMSRLVESWTSRAAAKQRRGRAGRVTPGVCYRVVPSALFSMLPAASTPEIQRTSLESLCLQVKVLGLGHLGDFMRSVLDPPAESSLTAAVSTLLEIGAVTRAPGGGSGADVVLSPLGYHLAMLPLDVRLGKALIFSAILRCVDPVLTIVAALSERSPWRPMTPATDPGERAAVEAARAKVGWATSDHLALVRVYKTWRDAPGMGPRRALCDSLGLSFDSMKAIGERRTEFAGVLHDLGFIGGGSGRSGGRGGDPGEGGGEYDDQADGDASSVSVSVSTVSQRQQQRGGGGSGDGRRGGDCGGRGSGGGGSGRYGEADPSANSCSEQANVIRAALVAGLWPNVLKVVTPRRRYHETAAGALPSDFHAKEMRFYTLHTSEDRAVASLLKDRVASQKRLAQRAAAAARFAPGGTGAGGKSATAAAAPAAGDGSDSDSEEEESSADEAELSEVETSAKRPVLLWNGFVQDRAFIHPASFNFHVGEFRCPWLVYHEKAETGAQQGDTRAGKVLIRDSSMVTPYALLLFGGPLRVLHREGLITVGEQGWVRFHAEARIGVLVKGLRASLNTLLAEKIALPGLDISTHAAVDAIVKLLVGNGM